MAALSHMATLWHDAQYAARMLRRSPTFAGVTMLALAIGIGANVGVFAVVDAMLLRSLPFRDPGRLAALANFIPPHDSAQHFHDWCQQSAYLADVALVDERDVNFGTSGIPERAQAAEASWNFFATLGAQPIIGRVFSPGEDQAGQNNIAVIGYGLWQRRFAGDARVLGSTIRVDGVPMTIVGVAPPQFDFPGGTVIWKPAEFSPGNDGWQTIARLKRGIAWPQARNEFRAEADRLAQAAGTPAAAGPIPEMTSLQDGLAGPAKRASLLMMAGVALILLLACASVANLALARTADRAREFSIRSALGASRGRLARELLIESLLLSSGAAVVGLAVAVWTVSIATIVQPPALVAQSYSILSLPVLGFAAIACVVAGLLFGALPSVYASRSLAFGKRDLSTAFGPRKLRDALLALQIAITVLLLTASFSVGRAFLGLTHQDRGFDAKSLVTVNVSLEGTAHWVNKRQLAYFEDALARLRALPAVQSASETEFLPLYASAFVGGPFGIDGRPAKLNSTMVPVLSDYFRTMGQPVLYGREFTDAEVRSGAEVAVVNERFASEFGEARDAVGRQLTIADSPPMRIVGVVKGMNYGAETAGSWRPTADSRQVFVPADTPGDFFSTFVVRVNGRAGNSLSVVRDTIRAVDPEVPVFGAQTMQQRLAGDLTRTKFYSTTVWFFAGFALLVTVIGMYGIVSFAVARRIKEMGVRMALGATPLRLRRVLVG